MKKTMNFLTVLYAIILFSSCGEQQNKYHKIAEGIMASKSFIYVENPDAVTIDSEKVEIIPYEELNSVLKEVKYIPLISEEPIGEFRKVIIYRERIYILDAFIAEKIFIFNMQGEIIKIIIDSKGGGPREYRGLMDMTVSSKDDCLVISDRLAPYVLYFSLDGEFVKKTRGIFNTTLEIINGKFLNQLSFRQSFDDNVNYHLVVTVNDSVERKGFPFYPLQIQSIAIPPFRYNYKDELLFCPDYSDTVYQIINDSVYTKKYIVKHRKSVWEKSGEGLNSDEYDRLVLNSDYTVLRKPILETEHFVYYPIEAKIRIEESYYRHSYPYWFDKKKATSFKLEDIKLEKLNPLISHLIPAPSAIYGNQYAGILDPTAIEVNRNLINFLKEKLNYALCPNRELNDMLTDENPDMEAILVLYEFKDSW
jgi:hypothetical protein